jgi:hypothetical protein
MFFQLLLRHYGTFFSFRNTISARIDAEAGYGVARWNNRSLDELSAVDVDRKERLTKRRATIDSDR